MRSFGLNVDRKKRNNVQLFPKVWILEISMKAFRISGSVSCSRLKAVFGYPYAVANSLSYRISNR